LTINEIEQDFNSHISSSKFNNNEQLVFSLDIDDMLPESTSTIQQHANHRANVNYYQTQFSPMSEDEIDQLLKIHVTAQANADLHPLQCSHSQECVSEISSIIENVNLGLNDDSHKTDETV
jgi:hypothetical protein